METTFKLSDVRQIQPISSRYAASSHLVEPLGEPRSDPDDIAAELGLYDELEVVEGDVRGWGYYNVIIRGTVTYLDYGEPFTDSTYYLAVIDDNELLRPNFRWWDSFLADTESPIEAIIKLQQYDAKLNGYRESLRGQVGPVVAKVAEYLDFRRHQIDELIEAITHERQI